MKFEEMGVPPDMLAYAIMMDQMVRAGAFKSNRCVLLEQFHSNRSLDA